MALAIFEPSDTLLGTNHFNHMCEEPIADATVADGKAFVAGNYR